ncbi:MAG: hypothetical protein M3P38_09410 [Chloroflexota bacterium]|nr:hypothetical protein [Chloroflexota bacterium]
MNSTEATPAPADSGRQIGQVLAGRYRLAMFKGGDDVADVWHALDDSTEIVVTLEILRDRGDEAARQRFLAEARRMAAIERPSVMRVASIHDGATDTFIVFEHLIPLPVTLTGLTSIAKDVKPATKAAEDTADALAAAMPQAPTVAAAAAPPVATDAPAAAPPPAPSDSPAAALPETPTFAPSTLSALAGPTRSATAPAAPANIASAPPSVDLKVPEPAAPQLDGTTARVPETLLAVRRSLTSVRPDMSGVSAWATGFAEEARLLFGDVRPDGLIVAGRELVAKRIDTSQLAALVTRVTTPVARLIALVASATARIRQVAATSSNARVSAPRAAEPTKRDEARAGVALPRVALPHVALPHVALPRVALPRVALPRISSLGTPFAAAGSLIARVLGNRAVLGSAVLILLAVAVVASPLNEAIVNAIRSATAPSPTAAPTATLVPAPFPLPPLGAYGATFESQAVYPTTTPNAVVEWVVALRNTGSAGWYRGIDGAQASLALLDGTGVAVQSTEYVAPGQVGWFVVNLRARAELGSYTVQLLPRIDGRGPLQDLGIFTIVTVAKNP